MADRPDDTSKSDPFGPPDDPCLCWCLHCHRQFMSDQMWYQRHVKHGVEVSGFWMCPTSNCDGAGFTFDIFPVDSDHPANEGWHSSDDEDDEFESDEFADDLEDEWSEPEAAADKPYDPAEPQYAELDAQEDVEGDEWKRAGEPAESTSSYTDEQEALFNGPDERPRVVDVSNEPDPPPMPPGGEIGESDIPF